MASFGGSALRIMTVGDSGTGKTCLLRAYMRDDSLEDCYTTIGVDFEMKALNVDGKIVNCQLWDTAGQERFRTITSSYYKTADAVLLVFDVCDRESFAHLSQWLNDIKQFARPHVEILLIGNKVDLRDRQVDFETASKWAESHGMGYIETSAKAGINVDHAFNKVAIKVAKRMEEEQAKQEQLEAQAEEEKRRRRVSLTQQNQQGAEGGGNDSSSASGGGSTCC